MRLTGKENGNQGFSLTELMIVLAIVGILAAIITPGYINHIRKARVAEMKNNLGELKIAEASYRAEKDTYKSCAAVPASVPGSSPVAWAPSTTCFSDLGFTPTGDIYYQYQVTAVGGTSFTATATGDLDDNGTQAVFTVTNNTNVSGPAIANEF